MTNKIVSTFLNYGFTEKTDPLNFEKHLFDDFKVIVSCEECRAEDGHINFYIHADRFTPFIEGVFSRVSNAKLIQPRKLIKDQSGCLCMVSTSVEIVDEELTLWLSGEEIRLSDVLFLFSEVKSIESFYESIYFRSNRYFIWIETIWVYLFLKKCIGVASPVEIYRDLNQESMASLVKRWNLKSELSVERLAEILLKITNIKGT
jgi:hypothetical protein